MFSVSSVKSEGMIGLSFIQYLLGLQEYKAHTPTAYKNVTTKFTEDNCIDEVIWHEILV